MLDRYNDASFNVLSFPAKLYALLEDADAQGFQHVISWQPGGKSFKVHKSDACVSIVKSYFSQTTKFKSFQRQLNIYGFRQVQVGPKKGGYQHKSFVRGSPELCDCILRRKEQKVIDDGAAKCIPPSIMSCSLIDLLTAPLIHTREELELCLPAQLQLQQECSLADELLEPLTSAVFQDDILQSMNVANDEVLNIFVDNIQDEDENVAILSSVLRQTEDLLVTDGLLAVAASNGTQKVSIDDGDEDLNFPDKLHLMLENAKQQGYSNIVSWVQDGNAFKVHDQKAFVERVMPSYFNQSKYDSFRRQLNLYQFSRVARGDNRGIVSHPCLVQGFPQLCKDISREGKCKAAASIC